MIPIRNKYVDLAFQIKEPIEVKIGKDIYTLHKRHLISPRTFIEVKDKYSNATHKLYYFNVPMEKEEDKQQLTLI